MGTYTTATIRGLAGRQAKANQQSVMHTRDLGKHAELGLKPTPRQLQRKELKHEIASLEVEISSLVRADNFSTTANRSALVKAIAQYLVVSTPLQKDASLPEIPLGSINAKLNNENGTSIGFSGRVKNDGSLSGYTLPTDTDLRAEHIGVDAYVLVTDAGMRADSMVEFKVYDHDYVYLDDQIWQYLVSECSLQTLGSYLSRCASLHGSFKWNPGYYLSNYAPLYGIRRYITVLKDETLEEELRICPTRELKFYPVYNSDTKRVTIPQVSIPEICRQIGPKHGLEYDDRGAGCLLRHSQPITKDDAMADLAVGSVEAINQTPAMGFYRVYDYGYDYMCRHAITPQLDVSGRTYNMFVTEAQAIFDRCQQYYDILQDALKLYHKRQA